MRLINKTNFDFILIITSNKYQLTSQNIYQIYYHLINLIFFLN